VLNEKAAAFYRRHGVTRIERAAESGLDLRGRRVMTARYCLKHQLGWCPRYRGARENQAEPPVEPLELVDEQGHHYPLRFNCKECQMEVYF
jgi:putative protease